MSPEDQTKAEVMEFGKKLEYFLSRNPGFGINVVTTMMHTPQGIGSQSMIQVCKLQQPKPPLVVVPSPSAPVFAP